MRRLKGTCGHPEPPWKMAGERWSSPGNHDPLYMHFTRRHCCEWEVAKLRPWLAEASESPWTSACRHLMLCHRWLSSTVAYGSWVRNKRKRDKERTRRRESGWERKREAKRGERGTRAPPLERVVVICSGSSGWGEGRKERERRIRRGHVGARDWGFIGL